MIEKIGLDPDSEIKKKVDEAMKSEENKKILAESIKLSKKWGKSRSRNSSRPPPPKKAEKEKEVDQISTGSFSTAMVSSSFAADDYSIRGFLDSR